MSEIIECVPNISEGQDPERIAAIVQAASSVAGVKLLHIDAGRAANRTVVTLAGAPSEIEEAAYQLIAKSVELIDLRKHRGTHPRVGATDVCPFVPLRNTSMQRCIEVARNVGQRAAESLSLPVYFYEEAATSPARKALPYLRQGGFEGLTDRMSRREFRPDEGPWIPHTTAGALIIGARKILIAYNVHLNTQSVDIAKKIAQELRTSGYTVREKGAERKVAGKLPACRAIGWYIEEYGCAEVSFNLLDHNVTGLYDAFAACRERAKSFGVEVLGSEIIGLVPMEALIAAGRRFANGRSGGDDALADLAIQELGLNAMRPFNVSDKTIEGQLER